MATGQDLVSDDSTLSTLTSPPSPSATSELTFLSRSPSLPANWQGCTPPPSQDAGEDNPRPRKRRKIEVKTRTTQTLDLTSITAQSEYDRQQSLETLVSALRGRRKIVVVAGAGISVAAGIPDFRSSHGLFKTLRGEHKLKGSGKQLFDASVYKDDSSTSHFHDMVRRLHKMSAEAKPTLFHRLLARLSSEGRLLRLYTQNVDGLETVLPPLTTMVPLAHKGPWPQTIQLHGGLEKMTCQKCHKISDFDATLFDGPTPPPCPRCVEVDNARTNVAGKRSHGIGRLRPRIVLYNEHNPDDEAIGAVTTADFRTRPDAVIVVGTSMKIPGVRRIVSQMCRIVRDRREGTTIWINRDGVPAGKDLEDCWDLIVKGDSDEVAKLANLREWDDPVQDIPEEYTDSDIEKVKSTQGDIRVLVPSPEKKPANAAISNLMASVMTPPRSHNGDLESKADAGKAIKPIKINLLYKAAGDKQKLKNPASQGRKLNDVIHQKEGKRKPGRPKTSVSKTKVISKKRDAGGSGMKQGKLKGKVSKAIPSTSVASSQVKKEPLSPLKDSELNAEQQNTCYGISDAEPASPDDSFSVAQSPPWCRAETISPRGSVPKDMLKLLN